jgi:predicted ATP-grasp superfamily ATP-dependent carboligase
VLFNGILHPTGLDLAGMAWSDFGLGEPLRPALTGWNGTWIHLQADLVCAVRYRRMEQLGLGAWLAPYRRPKVFADWSASDPKPFLAQSALALRGLLKAGSGGGEG